MFNRLDGFRTCTLWLTAAAAAVSLWAAEGDAGKGGGFGIGPGMVMVENIQPGAEEFDVAERTGFVFEVVNDTPNKHVFTLSARTAKSSLGSWEMGYDDLPDASWLRLDNTQIEVEAKSKGKVKLYIKIPDKPEHYNRKWMAVVACSPGAPAKGSSAVGLVVASRVQIETTANPDASCANEGRASLTPSMWMVSDAPPGMSWQKAVKVRNNTTEERTFTIRRIAELEKKDAKFDRYFGNGFVALTKDTWVKSSDASFKVKPGEEHALRLTVSVPKVAETGKRYEELVFLQDDEGKIQFIRLRTEVSTALVSGPEGKK